MDRYIGLDAHASSYTVAVLGPSGQELQCQVLETIAKALINFLKTTPNKRRLIFEEGILLLPNIPSSLPPLQLH